MKLLTPTEIKIFYYLNQKINEPNLCKYILTLKKEKEFQENQKFYIDIWERIAGSYYRSMEIHYSIEAKLLYNQEFLLRCDINLDYPVQSYFLITDISYESRNYLLYMIKNRTYIRKDIYQHLDKTYSVLSERCTYRQKTINQRYVKKKKKKKIKSI